MRFAALLLLLCLILPILGIAASLVLEPSALALGQVKQEQVIAKDVTLTNKGSELIGILRVFSDCSCTVAEPAQKMLEPGASTTLHVTVETKSFQGDIQKRVTVQTTAGEIALPITMSVSPFDDWFFSPVPAVLSPSLRNQEARGELVATYTSAGAGRILEARCNQPWVKAAVETLEEGKVFRVHLLKTTEAPVGSHSVVIVLKVQGRSEDVVSFPAVITVTTAARIVPNPVILPPISSGQNATATFRVLGWEGKKAPVAQISKGKTVPKGILDGEYTFEISVEGGAPGTTIHKLSLLDEDQSVMEAQVVSRVLPPVVGK